MALPGLTDAEHTDAQGNHVSTARAIDGTGLVFGSAHCASPAPAGPANPGVTGWVYGPDTGVTTRAALDVLPYATVDQICSMEFPDGPPPRLLADGGAVLTGDVR